MPPTTSRRRRAACLGAVAALALLAIGIGCQSGADHSPPPAVSPIDRSAEEPFAVLDEVLDGRRVVLLGESSHGIAEFYERKAALARYLHEELGYGILIFESGLADVATAYDDAAAMTTTELIDTSLLYNTDKLAPLFAHIQDTKGTPEPLRLAGMDVQSKTLAQAVQPLDRNRPVDARFLAMSDLQGRLLQTLLGEEALQGYNRLSRRFVAKADTLRFRHDDPGMMEGRLAELDAPEVFVDFARPTGRPAWIDDSLKVAHNTTFTRTIVPTDAFDGGYFLETVSAENYLSVH